MGRIHSQRGVGGVTNLSHPKRLCILPQTLFSEEGQAISHIVEKKSAITDLGYVKQVCARLHLPVEHDAVPRYYYNAGEASVCDLVIRLPGKYDLGLKLMGDASYAVVSDTELLSGSFGAGDPGRRLLGDNAALLLQGYNECKVEEMLMQSGISFTRTVDADGVVLYETADPVAQGLVQG